MHRTCLLSAAMVFMGILPFLASPIQAAELKPQTVEAWERYVALTEARIHKELANESKFLLTEFISKKDASECRKEVANGDVYIKHYGGNLKECEV